MPFAKPSDEADDAIASQSELCTETPGTSAGLKILDRDPVRHYLNFGCGNSFGLKQAGERCGDNNYARSHVTNPRLRPLGEAYGTNLFVAGLLQGERRVDFQDQRYAKQFRGNHTGKIEQGVSLVDEVHMRPHGP